MSVSLNNSEDIVANSIGIIKGNKTIDVYESISAVQGLAPETLNSLEKVATAIDNNPQFFQTVANKQATLSNGTLITGSQSLLNTATSKIKNIVGKNLTLTADDNNITIEGVDAYDKLNIDGKLETINTNVANKQAALSNGTLITGSQSLLNTATSKIKKYCWQEFNTYSR